jgi:hypothetical protein
MLTFFNGDPKRFCDGVSRRSFLTLGGLALYHVLGIDPAATIPDHNGRPQYVLDDRDPVKELI